MPTLFGNARFSAVSALAASMAVAACGDDGPVATENGDPIAIVVANPLEIPLNDNDQTVVTLDGSGSVDPDGDPLTFSWSVPGGTFAGGTSAASEVARVTFPGVADYVVTLTVSDGRGGSDQASVTIEVGGPANLAPTAVIAANPTSVPSGDGNTTVVTLDGSGSSDPEMDALTFSWSVQSGTFVEGTSASSEIAKVTFPGNAPYAVSLTVDDGNGNTDTAQITIAVS